MHIHHNQGAESFSLQLAELTTHLVHHLHTQRTTLAATFSRQGSVRAVLQSLGAERMQTQIVTWVHDMPCSECTSFPRHCSRQAQHGRIKLIRIEREQSHETCGNSMLTKTGHEEKGGVGGAGVESLKRLPPAARLCTFCCKQAELWCGWILPRPESRTCCPHTGPPISKTLHQIQLVSAQLRQQEPCSSKVHHINIEEAHAGFCPQRLLHTGWVQRAYRTFDHCEGSEAAPDGQPLCSSQVHSFQAIEGCEAGPKMR